MNDTFATNPLSNPSRRQALVGGSAIAASLLLPEIAAATQAGKPGGAARHGSAT